MPKVSIIVPIYNVEQYLAECLDSLVNQTLKDIEIICVNDGSTDNSEQIAKDFARKDKRIKIISKQNSGYGHTMNTGINAASSDYIGILESDDFAKPEMLEELYDLITQNDCDFVKSDFYNYISHPKSILKRLIFDSLPTNKVINAKENIKILKTIPSVWSAIYKKDFLINKNINFLETPGASYQDTSFHFKTIMAANRFILTDKAYVYYRNDNANSSVKSMDKVYSICEEFNEIHRYIQANKDLEYFEQFIYAEEFLKYRWNLNRIDRQYKRKFFEFFYRQFKNYYDKGLLKYDFYSFFKKDVDFKLFLEKPDKFYQNCLKREQKTKWNNLKRKFISIRINPKRMSVKLFGKQILRIE